MHASQPPPVALPGSIAVVGAGYVGRSLVERLLVAGCDVTAVTRRGRWGLKGAEQLPNEVMPEGLRLVGHDLVEDEPQHLLDALKGCSAVVGCYSRAYSEQNPEELYTRGAERLLALAEGLKASRLIWTSTTAALPDIDGVVEDDCPTWPDNPRGRLHRQVEQNLLSGAEALGLPLVILRLAGICGPGRELARIYRPRSETPAIRPPRDPNQATNLIHRDDVVEAIVAALGLSLRRSWVVNICDDDHCSRYEMQRAAGLSDDTRAPGPIKGKRVANTRMKQLLGLTLRHPTHLPNLR